MAFILDEEFILLDCKFIFKNHGDIEKSALHVGYKQVEHLLLETLFLVDQFFEMAALHILGVLRPPDIDYTFNLVAFAVVRQFSHQSDQSFGFNAANIFMASLNVSQQPIFLHLPLEKSNQVIFLQLNPLTQVPVFELSIQLTQSLRLGMH